MLSTATIDAASNASSWVITAGATLALQSCLLIAAGLGAAFLLRRSGTVTQSAILRVTLAGLLLCPLGSAMLERAGIVRLTIQLPQPAMPTQSPSMQPIIDMQASASPPPVPASPDPSVVKMHDLQAAESSDTVSPKAASPTADQRLAAAISNAAGVGVTASGRASGTLMHVYTILALAWLAGSSFLLIRLVLAHASIRRLRNSASHATGTAADMCLEMAGQLQINPPQVLLSKAV